MEIWQQYALEFAFAVGIAAFALFVSVRWLELREKRNDELEQFRATIEAMRRMEQQDGDR